MKLGIQPDVKHSPKEAFEFAAKNKFNHIEILMDHPLYALENLSFLEIIELKWSYDIDILIHAPATSTNFISISETMRRASYEEMRKVCNFAEKCDAEIVTFHIGWNPGFVTACGFYFNLDLYDKHNERVLMEEMYPFLKETMCKLALENTILIEGGLRRALSFLIENADLALTLDVGHYNIRKNEFFLENFDKVVNIHLHDNNGKFDEHLALGKGNVNLDEIPLKSYQGFLTIETREEKAILESKDYIERYLGVKG